MSNVLAKAVRNRTWLLCIGTTVLLAFGAFLDFSCWIPDFGAWLPRMGALTSLLGLIFESAYLFKSKGDSIISPLPNLVIPNEVDVDVSWVPFPDFKMHIGFYAILLGTIVWAFGDIISSPAGCSY